MFCFLRTRSNEHNSGLQNCGDKHVRIFSLPSQPTKLIFSWTTTPARLEVLALPPPPLRHLHRSFVNRLFHAKSCPHTHETTISYCTKQVPRQEATFMKCFPISHGIYSNDYRNLLRKLLPKQNEGSLLVVVAVVD